MPAANIETKDLVVKAEGFCAGGDHPSPPLDAFPLLAWTKAHPLFGSMVVHLEDQRASVHDVALAFAANPNIEAVAAQIGTTAEHARQAIDYADAWRQAHA